MRTIWIIGILVAVGMGLPARAEVVAGHELSHAEGLVQDMSGKLNRGLVNLLTGWCELPRQMTMAARERAWWASIPYGIPSGLLMTVVRTATGAFELVTFPIPIDDSYGPILHPAYVWQEANR